MRKWIALLICGLLLGSFVSASAQEEDDKCQGLVFLQSWVRPTIEGGNTAIYGTIVNLGTEDETLVAVEGNFAPVIEFHEVVMDDDDMMHMRPLEDGLPIPAGGFVTLEQGGLHIMVMHLHQALEAEQTVDITLQFEKAGDFTVTVPVDTPEEPVLYAFNTENCPAIGLWGGWARPVVLDGGMSAVYGLLLNLGEEDAVLLSVETDIAAASEIHQTTMADDDMMQMHPHNEGVLIPAGGAVLFEPGATHIMLISVHQPLLEGDTFDLTLEFESGESHTREIPVQP